MRAETCLKRVITYEDKAADRKTVAVLLGLLGHLYLMNDRVEEALPPLRTALEKSPQNSCLILLLWSGMKRQREALLRGSTVPYPPALQERVNALTEQIADLERQLRDQGIDVPHQIAGSGCLDDGGDPGAAEASPGCLRQLFAEFSVRSDRELQTYRTVSLHALDPALHDLSAASLERRARSRRLHFATDTTAELVVLSACQTALGTGVQGEDRRALARAAQRPGDLDVESRLLTLLLNDCHSGSSEACGTDHPSAVLSEERARARSLLDILRSRATRTEVSGARSVLPALYLSSRAAAGGPTGEIFDKATEQGARRALLVGIDEYGGRPAFRSLLYAARDAVRVSHALRALGYTTDNQLNEKAHRAALVRRLEQEVEVSRPGDRFTLYYSGHGITDLNGRRALVLPARRGDIETISLEEISGILSHHRGEVIVLVDSCFTPSPLGAEERAQPMGPNPPRFVVAASPGQIAVESLELRSGIYTQALVSYLRALRQLREPGGSPTDLQPCALFTQVGRETERITSSLYGLRQTPQLLTPIAASSRH